MNKLFLSTAALALAAAPGAANAAAYAYSRLTVTGATVAFAPAPSGFGSARLFSTGSANFTGGGETDNDNSGIPGVADADAVVDPFFAVAENDWSQLLEGAQASRADSRIAASGLTISRADAVAEARVLDPDFASADGETSASYRFTALAGTVVTITLNAIQDIILSTDFEGETAIGATSLDWSIRNGSSENPEGEGPFVLNTSLSVADGEEFSVSRSGLFTFTFLALAADTYTLSFTHSASVDVVAADVTDVVPAPAMVGLFGLALAGIGLARRRRA